MNNYDYAILSKLLFFTDLRLSTIASENDFGYTHQYCFFSVYMQDYQIKQDKAGNINTYDGIHEYDYPGFVGVGDTLGEAFRNFCNFVDPYEFINMEEVDKRVWIKDNKK